MGRPSGLNGSPADAARASVPRANAGRLGGARRGRVLAALLGVMAVVATSACGAISPHVSAIDPSRPALVALKLPATLSYTQIDTEVISPSVLVAVGVSNGRLDTVTLTGADGGEVPGAFDDDRTLWKATQQLAYDRAYRLNVAGTGDDGSPVTGVRNFSTLRPGKFTVPEIKAFRDYGPALDGGTFGVGQPIVVEFDRNVTDQAAATRALRVTTDPPTIGAWRWVRPDEVHWRPQEYWKPATKVTVAADVFGVFLGDGLFGQANRQASFTIGPSKIAIADHDSKRMHIVIDGVDVTASLGVSWNPGVPGPAYDHADGAKISMGAQGQYSSQGWFDMRTSSGPHVVMEKSPLVLMRPSLPKSDPLYYEERVPYAVRITASGEYVHWADWSVYDQGIRNVSHGCINMSPNDAIWFFNNFGYGDVVDVRNTGKGMDPLDGLGDWNIPWEQWIQG